MNRRLLILVAAILIVGAVIGPLIWQLLFPPQPQIVTVIEATQDIKPGTIISADMLMEVEREVTGSLPVVQASEQVVGKKAIKLIKKGEVIAPGATIPVLVPPDKEGISFYAEIDEAVGGILKRGDIIDIYAYHLVQEDEPTRMVKIAACILVVDSHGASGNPTRWSTPEAEEGGGSEGLFGVVVGERVVPASIVTVAVEPDIAWEIIEFLGSRGFRAWVTLSHESCWMPPTPTPTPTPIPPTPTPTLPPTPFPPTPTPTPTPGPRPDLSVVSITSDPSPMIKDQPGTVLVEVKNQGPADMVTTCWVGLYIDRPARAEADKQMVCPPLGVDESAVISYTVTLDEVGYHVLTAWADGLEAIPEEDEANNQDSASILCVEPPTPTPTPTPTNTPTPLTLSEVPTEPLPSRIHLIFNQWLLDITKVVDLESRLVVHLELKPGGPDSYYADYHGRGFEMTVENNTGEGMRVWREGEDSGADVFIDEQDGWEKRWLDPGQERRIKVQLRDGFNEATVVLVDDLVKVEPRSDHSNDLGETPIANLGGKMDLLSYDLETTVKPGEVLHLTLYWRAQGQMRTSYTVFTHLLDAQNRIWGQKDSAPMNGIHPTTSWVEGEIVADQYEIPVESHAPPGTYILEVGMYNAATGERLTAFDGAGNKMPQDRVLLGEVQVGR